MKNIMKILNANSFSGANHVRMHEHKGTEFILVTRGNCRIDAGVRQLEGFADTLFIIPAGMMHNQINHVHTVTNYMSFQIRERDFFRKAMAISLAGEKWIQSWMASVIEIYNNSDSALMPQSEAVLAAVIERVKYIMEKPPASGAAHPVFMKAVKFIDENISRALTAGIIARSCILSPSYLNFLFRKYTGQGPLKYLQKIRMARARRLLTDPYMPIKQVGISCGYSDVNYFCRIFKKHNNISPGQFRLQSLKKQK